MKSVKLTTRLGRGIMQVLRSGPWTRLLLALFGALAVSIVFVGLDDTPGYILGYLATFFLFLAMVKRWRSIKNFVILFLATFFIGVFLSGLYEEVVSRGAVWIGGPGAMDSLPMRIIDLVIVNIILFAGPVGLALGALGVLVLVVLRIFGVGRQKRAEDSIGTAQPGQQPGR